MDITYFFNDGVLDINVCGELDEHSAYLMRTTIDNIINSYIGNGPINVQLDLSQITFMDSTGIGVLLGRYKKFSNKNIIINLKNPSKNADKILKMAGIYEIMPKVS